MDGSGLDKIEEAVKGFVFMKKRGVMMPRANFCSEMGEAA